jgi:hypothetical protein
MTTIDLNTVGDQRSLGVIPPNTILVLQIKIRPGGVGDGGWLRRAKDGASEGLDLELTVVDEGPYKGRKLWQLLTVSGTKPGHADAGKISLATLKAIIESAKGIRPDDTSEAAQAARKISWQDFDGLRFVACLGVRPPEGSYPAKNTINQVITPERQAWRQPTQLDRDLFNKPNGGAAPAATTQAPANAVTRPQWAD